jgi:catechol 2,3-dioxygenase-like lactoylglutathione lyase family enzyme
MGIVLDHTIVPAHDKVASAQFFARLFGVPVEESASHFVHVNVNDDLTLLFDNYPSFESHHYAFHVDDAEFDRIFERVKAAGVAYGSHPGSQDNGEINTRHGGRGFYFKDPNGHSFELLTQR